MTAVDAAGTVYVPRPVDRESWLRWRREGIGGSDAAAIVNLDPWSSPMAVWLDKRGITEDSDATEAMEWGLLLENIVADEFERRTGLYVTHRQLCALRADEPFLRVTLDGHVAESRDPAQGAELGVFESKTTGREDRWEDGVPFHVQLQVQHQMLVTGLRHAWVAVLIAGQRMEIFELERDELAIGALLTAERSFWKRVVDNDAPPVTDHPATVDALRSVRSEPGKTVELPVHARPIVEALRDARSARKAAGDLVTHFETFVRSWLLDADEGTVDGQPVVTWTQSERAGYEVAPTTVRTLRLVDPDKPKRKRAS